ncbi:MAG: SDR family NAD(P)-dependent oxidoreductase, partial [Planctomycetes bacterium]|nr:SDR family NAD(P)-dependent oxidoreductase [Planctomycetota bacterium]
MRLPDLAGRRALITGTADGIGRATAAAFIEQGAEVWGIDVRPATFAGAYHHLTCDLGDAAAIAACIAELASRTGHLDHLVNVAGIDPK